MKNLSATRKGGNYIYTWIPC